jgi:hypothetical protein
MKNLSNEAITLRPSAKAEAVKVQTRVFAL